MIIDQQKSATNRITFLLRFDARALHVSGNQKIFCACDEKVTE
jgi:hypothetical protein